MDTKLAPSQAQVADPLAREREKNFYRRSIAISRREGRSCERTGFFEHLLFSEIFRTMYYYILLAPKARISLLVK